MTSEERSISRLRAASLEIDDARIAALEEFFRQLRSTDQLVSGASPTELYEAQWAILGIVSRSYQLMLCCIDQIAGGNWNGFYASARGLAETLCSIAWASEAPDRLVALVSSEQRDAGKMLNAGYQRHPGLKQMYRFLSSIVHPNREAHLLGVRPVEQRAALGVWSPFVLEFSDCFAARKITLLEELGSSINRELTELLMQNPDVVKRGRIMTQLVVKARDDDV